MSQLSMFDPEPQVKSVSEINSYIRHIIEADFTLQNVWVQGEISNWKQAASGHIYFTLKDPGASIRCVVWRSQAGRLWYTPQQEGEAVLAHGRVSVYEVGGNYQFYVDNLEPAGQGALYARFERIKARLGAEGLFDPDRKQPLPEFPQTIGIVTSPDAAALRDILNVLRRRYPVAQVILSPTQVQGEDAPPQIIEALDAIIRQQVDVIIVARGGGSIEDLWAFNDEVVARVIADCPIPLVTGIGHETDFTIADFVADVRAPTPSAAAELVSPDKGELRQVIAAQQYALIDLAQDFVQEAQYKLQRQIWNLERLSPQAHINNYRQRVDTLVESAGRTVRHRLELQGHQVKAMRTRLTTLNPYATLDRGYAIVQKGQMVITKTGQVSPGDALVIKVKDGEIDTIVQDENQEAV